MKAPEREEGGARRSLRRHPSEAVPERSGLLAGASAAGLVLPVARAALAALTLATLTLTLAALALALAALALAALAALALTALALALTTLALTLAALVALFVHRSPLLTIAGRMASSCDERGGARRSRTGDDCLFRIASL